MDENIFVERKTPASQSTHVKNRKVVLLFYNLYFSYIECKKSIEQDKVLRIRILIDKGTYGTIFIDSVS